MRINTRSINLLLARQSITKSELAKRSGLTKQATCQLIKRGTCEPRTAGKIARALGVDVEELIEHET